MKRKTLLYSAAILATLATSTGIAYQIGLENGKEVAKSASVNYVTETSGKSQKDTSKQTSTNTSKDHKEDIAAEQIIVKITDDGYVTSHGDHFHFYNGKVPFDGIFSEDLLMKDPSYALDQSHIVSDIKDGHIIKVNGQYYVYLESTSSKGQLRSHDEVEHQRQHNAPKQVVANGAKQGSYTTDDGYVFNPKDIVDDLGDALIVRHGSHMHYIPKADLSASDLASIKAQKQPATKSIASAQDSQSVSSGRQVVPTTHAGAETSSTQNMLEEKRAYMAKMYDLPLSEIKVAGDYFTYPHGTHRHALLISKVIVGQFPTAASVAADLNHGHEDGDVHDEAHHDDDHGHEGHHESVPSQPQATPAEKPQVLPGSESKPAPVTPSTGDQSLEAKIKYISDLYGINPSTIQVQGDSLVWPHEDHTHSMEIALIRIPQISDDPEADFEAELTNLANSLQVDPASVTIKDGTMVIPHGDHTHTYRIKSPGWRDYLKNRIPTISGAYIPGPLKRQVVRDRIQELITEAEGVFKDNPKQFRRVKKALLDFENLLDWGTNSTEGYLTILDDFAKKYIQSPSQPAPAAKPVNTTVSWKDLDALLDKVQMAFEKATPQDHKSLATLEEFKQTIGYRQGSAAELKKALLQFVADHQLTLEKEAEAPVDLDAIGDFEKASEQVHTAISKLSEKTQLLKRIAFFNKLYDAKKLEDLKAILAELNSLNAETKNPDQKQLDSLKQYLLANQADARLTNDLKAALQSALASKTTTLQEFEALKQRVKDRYQEVEEKQASLAARITDLLSQTATVIGKLTDAEKKAQLQKELDDLKNLLQLTTSDKEALLLQAQDLKARTEVSQVTKETPAPTSPTVDPKPDHAAEAEVKGQIQSLIDFITANRRGYNPPQVTDKVKLLNKADDLEEQFNSGKGSLTDLLAQFQGIKASMEPHIKASPATTVAPEQPATQPVAQPTEEAQPAAGANEAELKSQIQSLIDFITANRRNYNPPQVADKAQLLNRADDLEAQFNSGKGSLTDLLAQLQGIKATMEPHIKVSSTTSPSTSNNSSSSESSWNSGW